MCEGCKYWQCALTIDQKATMTTRVKNTLQTTMPAGYGVVHGGIVELLQAGRAQAMRSVNALMTVSY